MKPPILAALGLTLATACIAGITLGLLSVRRPHAPSSYPALTAEQSATLRAAMTRMQHQGLPDDDALATTLLRQGKWHPGLPIDPYLTQAEQSGDTPYAYTLADGKKIIAVVLAPRFFTETTAPARAALMAHELGHVRAYLQTGHSDEYDGYKHEYDTHARLGLTERDGLPYFAMLDGVVEYVLPRAPAYKNRPDMKAFLSESGNL